MRSKSLELYNFRNYSHEIIDFENGVNIICGDNGMGKTNIIEAVYYFSHGRSFRSSGREIVKDGEEQGRIKLKFEKKERIICGEIKFCGSKKKEISLNEIELKKTSQLIGNMICVLFTPDEMSIIKGSPDIRRRFLDSAIMPLRHGYVREIIKYRTVLNHKAALLHTGKYETLPVWNEKLSESGVNIVKMRESYIKRIGERAKEIQNEISSGKENLNIRYIPSVSQNEEFLKKLEENEDREKEQAVCLFGPHRDDIIFEINGKNAKYYASQGQIRTAVMCLKIAQNEIIYEETGEYPVLLLDDILSELDKKRREYMIREIKGKQVIITCTDIDSSFKNENIIKIKDGKIVR